MQNTISMQEEDLNKTLKIVKDKFENIDFIIHAVAYSDKNELNGRYIETSKDILSTVFLSRAILSQK